MESDHRLAELLAQAAADPAHRPAFYRAILESTVYVIGMVEGRGEAREHGAMSLVPGDRLAVQHWTGTDGTQFIPFFTSREALERAIREHGSYVALPARALFEMTRGAVLHLDPGSGVGKEFLPHEVAALLETGMPVKPATRVVEKATQVLLGQPSEYPSALVDALTTLFLKHPNVKAAYLTLMQELETTEAPHLVVGIETDGDPAAVLQEAGTVISEIVRGRPVDLVRVEGGRGGIDRYFVEETRPFYSRRWGARLRSAFGFGRA